MSTATTTSDIVATGRSLHTSKPSFFGLVRGELFKINRQLTTWIMLVLFVGAICLPYLILFIVSGTKDTITASGSNFLYSQGVAGLAVLRIFSGFVLVILTARVIGQEYQLGTIRVVLARGVGRVQFLLAKLSAVVIWALLLLIIGLALSLLLTVLLIQLLTGNLNALPGLDNAVWHDIGVYILTILVSMGATILMTTAITVLFRSFVGGLSASIAWFPVDNILGQILFIVFFLTKNDFWQNVSAYLLGPNLNVMAGIVANVKHGTWAFGSPPLVQVDGNHTLLTAAVYALIFAFVAFFLTWKRDVKE